MSFFRDGDAVQKGLGHSGGLAAGATHAIAAVSALVAFAAADGPLAARGLFAVGPRMLVDYAFLDWTNVLPLALYVIPAMVVAPTLMHLLQCKADAAPWYLVTAAIGLVAASIGIAQALIHIQTVGSACSVSPNSPGSETTGITVQAYLLLISYLTIGAAGFASPHPQSKVCSSRVEIMS